MALMFVSVLKDMMKEKLTLGFRYIKEKILKFDVVCMRPT